MIHTAMIRPARPVYGCLILCLSVGWVWGQEPPADPPTKTAEKPPAAKSGDLDDDILKLLSDDAAEELGPAKPLKPTKPVEPSTGQPPTGQPGETPDEQSPTSKPIVPGSALDRELTRDLEDDESVDQADPLKRAGSLMRQSESRIRVADAGKSTQELQDQIVADLDAVLKALQENQKKGKSQPSTSSKPSNSQRNDPSQPQRQPDQGQPNGPRNAQEKPAQESTDQAGKADPNKQLDGRTAADLLRETWGHLPERDREILIQASKMQYLPEYQKLIEDYYTRLAKPRP